MNNTAYELQTNTLAHESNLLMRQFFEQKTQHQPSTQMFTALEEITETLEAMANGNADPKIYLSSLDPGVGKTSALAAFIESLIGNADYSHIGVMICLARLDEIRHMVDRIAIPKDSLCVLTSDPEINSLGGANADEAQVLITTQQRLENHLDGSNFASASEFHYNNQPRGVRIWDETWLPGIPVTIGCDDISSMLKQLRPIYPELTRKLDIIISDLRELKSGSKYSIPDFERNYGVDLNSVLGVFDQALDGQLPVTSLWYMSGKTVTIKTDDRYGNVMLTYRQTLPNDIAPMLVLDASGRVRETYSEMEAHRNNIVRLTPAPKDYANLNLHVWRTGGGKSSWSCSDKNRELLDGIVSTIKRKPNEEWLVVVHKPNGRIRNIKTAVEDLLSDSFDISKIHFINWGNHMATNEYANVPNVILAGTLFYRPSYYEAIGRLAADRHPSLRYSKTEQKRIEMGEHLHGILQALCRASVRQCKGNLCAPCNAYVIASVRSGIPDALPTVFPGAKIKDWRPIKVTLKGKIKEAVDYIDKRLSEGVTTIKFVDVKKSLGIKSSSNFSKDIRLHADFQSELNHRGIIEWGAGQRLTAFRLIDGSLYGFLPQ